MVDARWISEEQIFDTTYLSFRDSFLKITEMFGLVIVLEGKAAFVTVFRIL